MEAASFRIVALLAIGSAFCPLNGLHAQGTAFTYQGRLTEGMNPASGVFDFHFTIFNAAVGGTNVTSTTTNSAVGVTNGLFTTALDFGAAVFNGADLWLEIGVRSNTLGSFTTLVPRQPITPTPYAINAANLMSFANAPLDIKVNGQRALRLEPTGGTPNLIGGSASNSVAPGMQAAFIGGGGIPSAPNRILASAASIVGGSGHTNTAIGAFIGGGWMNVIGLNANDAVIGGGFQNRIGNDDLQGVIVGGLQNIIGSNTWYSVIGGGNTNVIEVDADNAVISGGNLNRVQFNAEGSGIGGGTGNIIQTNASGARIDGGFSNFIGTNSFNSSIGGGNQNSISNLATEGVIGGGFRNKIESDARWATIGGGIDHQIRGNTRYGVIAGGAQNSIQTNVWGAAIGGGGGNTNRGYYATIPGGLQNIASADYAFAAGRRANATNLGSFVWADSIDADFFSTTNNQFSIRAGGGVRFVTGGAGLSLDGQPMLSGPIMASNVNAASFSNTFWKANGNAGTSPSSHFVGTTDNRPLVLRVNDLTALLLEPHAGGGANVTAGGNGNWIQTNSASSTIAGGEANRIESGSGTSTISGGGVIVIRSNSTRSVIGGGYQNTIQTNAGSSVIAGGAQNVIGAPQSSIGGGAFNTNNGGLSVIGGGGNNFIETTPFAYNTIAGGRQNLMRATVTESTIGGGLQNEIFSGGRSTIAGGYVNYVQGNGATIGGGEFNLATATDAVVMGGNNNAASGAYSVVPGGSLNIAGGDYSFAAGRQAGAGHAGTFVWADSQVGAFSSTAPNQFLIRSSGGVGINTPNPIHSLTVGASETPVNTPSIAGFYKAGGSYVTIRDTTSDAEALIGADSTAIVAAMTDHALSLRAGNNAGSGNVEYMRIARGGNVGIGITVPTNKLHVAGGVSAIAFVTTSDRNAKENFALVSPKDVLNKVVGLPISTWNFKTMNDGRHMGPMAQDFYAAFGLGGGESTIASVDPDGVALAAIQGLNQKLEETRNELKARDRENGELRERLEKLEKFVENQKGNSK